MKIWKDLVKDPSNEHRKKWGYFCTTKKKGQEYTFRITRELYFDTKYNRLPNKRAKNPTESCRRANK